MMRHPEPREREEEDGMGFSGLAPTAAERRHQSEIERLRQENERLTANIVDISAECRRLMVENKRQKAALESLTKDPPATLSREPDTDAEVIIKMRAIALGAITNGYQNGD